MPPSAQIIFFNGTLATQTTRPFSGAVAVGEGKITAVGSDQDVLNLAGPDTETIDLDGRLVLPGLIDSHIHFYEWALKRRGLKLDTVTCIEDLLSCVHEATDQTPPGQWITGQGWNETAWTHPCMPTRDVLDRAAPAHPVLLWRCDLHLAAANSAALNSAGININTPDPPDGRIERDRLGKPTGILRETAINHVREAMPPPDAELIMTAFEDATKALHRRGVTGICDIRLMADQDGNRSFKAFQNLDLQDRLNLRTWVSLPGQHLDQIVEFGLCTGFGGDRLRVGHLKFFADGGMGARTAWLIDPYLDAERGMPLVDMDDLARDIRKADAAGLSVMVHAVGDRANRELITIFEDLESKRSPRTRSFSAIPHRLEHLQMLRPEDARRLRNLHVALCVTPANLLLDIALIDSALGEKGKWTYSFRRIMDTGVPVMFSSDCPVCDPDPLLGIHAAVTRMQTDGTPQGGWYPESRVSVTEAVKAYTITTAAVHHAGDLGVILPDHKADLVILDKNIYTLPLSQLHTALVDMTLFDGRIVYRRSE
jgi:predicted amidohydrolase YtcJ